MSRSVGVFVFFMRSEQQVSPEAPPPTDTMKKRPRPQRCFKQNRAIIVAFECLPTSIQIFSRTKSILLKMMTHNKPRLFTLHGLVVPAILLGLFTVSSNVVKVVNAADDADHHNHLVILMGPKYTGLEETQKFFLKYASYYEDNAENYMPESISNSNWIFPAFDTPLAQQVLQDDDTLQPHNLHDLLVTHKDNDDLHHEIVEKILQDATIQGTGDDGDGSGGGGRKFKNVILASDLLDPGMEVHVMGVVERLREKLNNIPKEHVTMIINYRTPRHKQWIDAWKDSKYDDYKAFVCPPKGTREYDALSKIVGTDLSPLRAAMHYKDNRKYPYKIVDVSGMVKKAGQRTEADVLACDIFTILHDDRKDHDGDIGCIGVGSIQGIPRNGTTTTTASNGNNNDDTMPMELTRVDITELESWFRMYDCNYQFLTTKNVVFGDTIWKGCDTTYSEEAYKEIKVDVLLNNIRNQVGCGESTEEVEEDEKEDTEEIKEEIEIEQDIKEEKKEMKKQQKKGLEGPIFLLLAVIGGVYYVTAIHQGGRLSNNFTSVSGPRADYTATSTNPYTMEFRDHGEDDDMDDGGGGGGRHYHDNDDDNDNEEDASSSHNEASSTGNIDDSENGETEMIDFERVEAGEGEKEQTVAEII